MTVTTEHFYSGNNSTTSFAYTFPYYKTSDIKVKVGGTLKTEATHYNITGTNVVFTSGNVPPNGTNNIHIYRETDVDTSKATFAAGSSIRATDLNNNETQLLYHAQEQNFNKIQTADVEDGAITSAKILDGTIATADIADNAVTAAKLATNSIDATNLAANSVGASEIADNAVDTAAIADDAVTSAKIATGAVIADGLATNAVTTVKIHNDAVETAKINDSAVTTAKINNSAVTSGKIATDAVTTAKILDANVTTNKIANDSVTTDKLENSINASIAANTAKTTNATHTGEVTGATSLTITNAAVVADRIATNAVTTAKIQDNAVTTAKIADAELTTLAGMQSGTASILASGTALTSTTAELNLLDGKSIVTSVSGSSTDVQLPTAKAVNDQIVNTITDVGGFVPIANEVSFPNANPDPGDDAGTIVSIADAGGIEVNGSGVSTTGRTLGGSTVTITGIDASLYNTTIAAGKGMLVQTTGTLNTYTYHRLVLDEAGVAAAQAAIDDYDERYYGALSSAPSTKPGGGNRANGDMYFDTTSNKMKVFNATTSAWDDVATSASSFISTLSPAFDGSETEFTASSVPVDAQSAIISINGVIQKPNSGTSTPSEGYVQLANDKIKFATAPPSGADYFMITLGNAVSIGTPSNNTVSTAIIQNGAVTTDKIANDAVTADKIADDTITQGQLANSSVGTGELADNAVTGAKVADNLDIPDNNKIRFGTGNDLEIYHQSSDNGNYIDATNSNPLFIQSDLTYLLSENGNEHYLKATKDGAVELYYDNSKKFETTAAGATVTGRLLINGDYLHIVGSDLYIDDTKKAFFGNGADLSIYHDATDSFVANTQGSLTIKNTGNINLYTNNTEDAVVCTANGAVALYYNGAKKFETTSSGIEIYDHLDMDDNHTVRLGTGADLQIYHDGSNSTINNSTGYLAINGDNIVIRSAAQETGIQYQANASVDLYYNGTKKFETYTSGVEVIGNLWLRTASGKIQLNDNIKLICGNGDDLQIFHDGTNSYVNNATGDLYVQSASGGDDVYIWSQDDIFLKPQNGEEGITINGNGAVELYYDNSKKARTHSTGFLVDTGYLRGCNDGNFVNLDDNSHGLRVTNDNWGLRVVNSHASSPYGIEVFYNNSHPDNGSLNPFFSCRDDQTNRMRVYSDGDVWNHDDAYGGSDATLKENIVDASSKLEDIKKLKVRNFNWKADYFPEKSKKKMIGFIAQEVEQVFPNLVSEHDIAGSPNDGHTPVMKKAIKKAWDPIIIKAMQELIEKVETLETKVAALEAK